MSVPKSQRGKSKVDFDNLILRLQENLVDAAEHHFYAKAEAYQEHKLFLDDKAREILAVGDLIMRYCKTANVYPTNLFEYERRRNDQNHIIGLCYHLLTMYQVAMHIADIPDSKHVDTVDNINHVISSVKKWRTSDNHFKRDLAG